MNDSNGEHIGDLALILLVVVVLLAPILYVFSKIGVFKLWSIRFRTYKNHDVLEELQTTSTLHKDIFMSGLSQHTRDGLVMESSIVIKKVK